MKKIGELDFFINQNNCLKILIFLYKSLNIHYNIRRNNDIFLQLNIIK